MILAEVRDAVREVASSQKANYTDAEHPTLVLVSPLAPGSDSLAADVAVNGLGYVLDAPFPYDLLANDPEIQQTGSVRRKLYDGARSRLVLDGIRGDLQAYQEVGLKVVSNADLIIGIWDGRPSPGPGSTAKVVELARQQGVPVVLLHSEQENSFVLRLPDGDVAAGKIDDLRAGIKAIVRLVLTPPAPAAHEEHPMPDLREDYFAEEPPRWPFRFVLGKAYAIVTGLLAISLRRKADCGDSKRLHLPLGPLPPDYIAATRAAWHDDWNKAGVPREITTQLERKLIPHFAWANQLAVLYAIRYRSVFFWTYVLAFCAVAAAVLGHRAEARHEDLSARYEMPAPAIAGESCANMAEPEGEPYCRERKGEIDRAEAAAEWWPRAELLALIVICVLYVLGQFVGKYHVKWVDYRSLAERIRHLSFLLPLGQTSPAIRVPAAAAHADPSYTWLNWVFRAIVREVGLFDANLDAVLASGTPDARPAERPYLEHCRALLDQRILGPQERYHCRSANALGRLHGRLEAFAATLFGVALLISVVHLVIGSRLHLGPETWLTLAVLLPTAGATLHGFLSQGDFESAARRSDSTAKRLGQLREDLRKVSLGSVAERTKAGVAAHQHALAQLSGEGLRQAVVRPMLDRLDGGREPLLASVLPDLKDRLDTWVAHVSRMSEPDLRELLGRRKLRDYPPAASAELGRIARQAADAMGEELIGWRVDSQTKELTLS